VNASQYLKYLLPVSVLAAIAMVPQDPQPLQAQTPPPPTEQVNIVTMSDLQYVNLQGVSTTVAARTVVEIRLLEECTQHIRLELIYDNGDFSLLDVQAFHLLRNGSAAREVRLVRSKTDRMRFPRLP
jgi:hypothetical protein